MHWCMFVMLLKANASLCGLFCQRNRADYHGNVWRWSDFRFTFVKVIKADSWSWITNLVPHRKRNIQTFIWIKMLMAQISQFTSTKIAVIVHRHLMTKEHAHFMCHNLEWSLLVSCTCVVCNKCVLIGTVFVVCWYPLQTVWTQIRPDKKSGLIWIRTVWHSFWCYPSKTIERSLF